MYDESRFKIIKCMLNEFPKLREKVKKWLQENSTRKVIVNTRQT